MLFIVCFCLDDKTIVQNLFYECCMKVLYSTLNCSSWRRRVIKRKRVVLMWRRGRKIMLMFRRKGRRIVLVWEKRWIVLGSERKIVLGLRKVFWWGSFKSQRVKSSRWNGACFCLVDRFDSTCLKPFSHISFNHSGNQS